MSQAVAIVEWECFSPLGMTADLTWGNMAANRSGIGEIDRYDPSREALQGVSAAPYGGQIPLSYAELAGSSASFKRWPEPSRHAVPRAAREILEKLGFDVSRHDRQKIACLGGTAFDGQLSRDVVIRGRGSDPRFILNQCHNVPLAVAAGEAGLQGPCFSINGACASSGQALLMACQFLRTGLIDCALVVGFDFPLLPVTVGGLSWLNALYRTDEPGDRGYDDPALASRPFSGDRRGFLPAEGVAAVFLSRVDYARAMDWPVKGLLRGGHTNSDAGHLTRGSERNIAHCIRSALSDSGCDVADVDCVNAHATSTPAGDRVELLALSRVFGERLKRIPVVANKSQLGHCVGASSALGLILAVRGMNEDVVLPTLNHIPDPSLPEAFIPHAAMEYHHRLTLLDSFGFGGANCCLVVERGGA